MNNVNRENFREVGRKNTLRELTQYLNDEIKFQPPTASIAPMQHSILRQTSKFSKNNSIGSLQNSAGSILKFPSAQSTQMSTFKHRNSIRVAQTVQRVINESDMKMVEQRRRSVRNIFGLQVQPTHLSGQGSVGTILDQLSPYSAEFKKIANNSASKKHAQPRRSIRINEANNIIIEAFDGDGQPGTQTGGFQFKPMKNIIEKVREEEEDEDFEEQKNDGGTKKGNDKIVFDHDSPSEGGGSSPSNKSSKNECD